MAITGSASRASRASTLSGSSTDDNPPVKQKRQSRHAALVDSDLSEEELTEKGSDICQVGEDVCAVPAQLFDLSSLKEVLSLHTWNYSLTEEERHSLALLLPPLEEEDVFKDNMRELLGGENFHFGSPVADLFDRLKGGLCHPRVLGYREGLKYLQRKEHYHLMRQYHNRMVNLFVDMQKAWETCPEADVDERLEIWQRQQPQPQVARKPVPKKTGSVKRMKAVPEGTKKGKSLQHGRGTGATRKLAAKKSAVLLPVVGSKGVLKLRSIVKGVPEGPSKRVAEMDQDRVGKPGPKGVLKVASKGLLKKADTRAFKGKAPMMEVKKVVEGEAENEEEEAVTPTKAETAVLRKVFTGEGSEKKPRKKSTGESKKRKTLDEVGESHEVEKSVKKKKRPKDPVPDEVKPLEEVRATPDKGKNVGDGKRKPHRKKKVEEKVIEPEEMEVEEKREVEDEGRVSDEIEEVEVEVVVEEDRGDLSKDEGDDKQTIKKRPKKKAKVEKAVTASPAESSLHTGSPGDKGGVNSVKSSKKLAPLTIPSLASTFPFSVTHLLSAVRAATMLPYGEGPSESRDTLGRSDSARESFDLELPYVMSSEGSLLPQNSQSPGGMVGEKADGNETDVEKKITGAFSVPFAEIVRRVQVNPGDPRVLETQEPLQDLVRGALKIMGSKVSPQGAKGWKPLVLFDKETKAWSWTGPLPLASTSSQDVTEVKVTAEEWGIPQKTLLKLEEMFATWLKHGQDTLQQIVQLPLPPPPPMPLPVDEKERFRDLRAQKSLMTIAPSSEDMRVYFRREELLRYSLPDRAFPYTTADGHKAVVAPLRRGGGKPTSKARDHFMLKPDRPPHVTILCLVRDAAARLPGSIGTRADVCALIRDSQFIVEDVSDAQVNQVVSGALDRLHYERDPCVRFDGDRKLWVYLHTEREEEDFEDDGTSSTKRWKKPKKDSAENSDHGVTAYETGSPSGPDQDGTGASLSMDMHSPDGMGGPGDPSAIYSVGRTELVYNKSSSLTSPRVLGNGPSRSEGVLPFIELPPAMHGGHPIGWEGVSSQPSWEQESHLQSQESLGTEDDYDIEAAAAAQRDADAMLNADTE